MKEAKENIPNLKSWKGCKHPITRKLYFQRDKKWITTEYSICENCGSLIKKIAIESKFNN